MYINKIRKYRELRGLTLRELALRTGISAGYLSHLERGDRNNPSKDVMENISYSLGVPISRLFFGE